LQGGGGEGDAGQTKSYCPTALPCSQTKHRPSLGASGGLTGHCAVLAEDGPLGAKGKCSLILLSQAF